MNDRSAIDQWYRRLPRYLYVEDLIRGRVVVEIGCGVGVGTDFLVERRAARVVGVDRDAQAIEKARQRYAGGTVEFARWERKKPLPAADASADLVVVPEALPWLDEEGFLDQVRRVLRPEGQLLIAAPSADKPGATGGLGYYDLIERLEALFPPVRMIGQTPFLAYGMVEYVEGDEEPELSLDTSLVEGSPETVSHYLALCGPESGPLRGYSIVQIPFGPLENRVLASELPPPAPVADPRVKELGRRVADLEERLREARQKEEEALALAEQAATRARSEQEGELSALRDRLAEAADERSKLELECGDLKRRLAEADQEMGRITAQATAELAALAKKASAPSVSPAELRERDERIALLEGERQGLEWRVQELEGRLSAADRKWEGIVQDLEERLRSREQAFEEARQAAEKHRAEMAARDEASAEQVACVLELEEELGAMRGRLAELERRLGDEAQRAEAAEAREREARQRAAVAEGELIRLRNQPPQVIEDTAAIDAAQAEIAKMKEKLALASSQTDVWMTKFRESERKAEEARDAATRKLLDAKSAAGTQLQRALEESTNNLARARDEAQRAEKQRREVQQKLDELARELEAAKIERDDARHKLGEAEAARARAEQRLSELASVIAEREAQLERLAGVAVVERRAAEDAQAREREVREAVAQAAAAREEAAREAKAALDQVVKLQVEVDAARGESERVSGQGRMREREVEAHVEALERELVEARAAIEAAARAGDDKLTEAASTVAEQAAELTELHAKAANLEKELSAARRELSESSRDGKEKQRALTRLGEEAHERKAELVKVRRELKDKERAAQAAQAQLAEAEDKSARLMSELGAIGKQLARQEKTRAPSKKDKETDDALARLREEIKFRKADLEETEAALKKAHEHEEQQRLELLRREAELEKLTAARDKAEERAKAEAELRKKAVEEAERAGERAQQARGEVVAARGELSKARGSEQAAAESERKLRVAAEETKERIKALKRELEHAEKHAAREAERVARLEKDIEARVRAGDSAAAELADLRTKLAEMSAQATARSARIGELEVEMEEARRERNEYERALRLAETEKSRDGEPGRRVAEIGARLQAFEAGMHLEEERLAGIEELIEEATSLARRLVDPAPLEARISELGKALEKREEELQEHLMEIDRLRTEERKLSAETEDALRQAVLNAEIGDKEAEILMLHGRIAGFQRRVAKLRQEIDGYQSRAELLTPEEIRGLLDELSADIDEMEKEKR